LSDYFSLFLAGFDQMSENSAFIEESLKELNDLGFSTPALERALDLESGSLEKSYGHRPSYDNERREVVDDGLVMKVRPHGEPELIALFKILRRFPWMIQVAERNFDTEAAQAYMIEAAGEILVQESQKQQNTGL
jgi:hypothetical protein